MRLNFSGVGEDDIREGVRRIGKVVARAGRALLDAHGSAGVAPAPPPRRRPETRRRPPAPRRRGEGHERSRCSRAALARAQGLAALGRARRGRAGAARPRGGADRRRRRPRRPAASGARPTSRSSRCTAAAARTARCRSCSSWSASRTRRPARRPASAAWTRCWPSTCCATPASRRPTSTRSARPPSRSWARRGAAGDRGAARLPDRGQARRPGLGARDQVRPHAPRTCPRDRGRLLLRHEGAARALRRRARPRGLGARRRRAGGAAGGRGDPARGGLLRLRGALRDRPHDVRLPGRPRRGGHRARAQELALAASGRSAARLRARRPDARGRRPAS